MGVDNFSAGVPWLKSLSKTFKKRALKDDAFNFLFEPPAPNEWMAIDCETTGLDVRRDEIISIAAIPIVGQQLLTSKRLELLIKPSQTVSTDSVKVHRLRQCDLVQGLDANTAIETFLRFVGSRPLVGYYTEFDVAMLNKLVQPLLGIKLPNDQIDVCNLYYDFKFKQLPPYQQYANADIDLRFTSLMKDLQLPTRDGHDAFNDAQMAALAFVKLKELMTAK
jgi:DNA polymerase-3 subunit epsilon